MSFIFCSSFRADLNFHKKNKSNNVLINLSIPGQIQGFPWLSPGLKYCAGFVGRSIVLDQYFSKQHRLFFMVNSDITERKSKTICLLMK